MFKNIKQVVKSTYHDDKIIVTVMTTNYCNYMCEYCCEGMQFIKTKKMIDYNQFYIFINYIINTNKFKTIEIELYGGEPTLHPDLYEFCKKFKLMQNIHIRLYTNFSASLELYTKILELNNTSLLIAYHWNQNNTPQMFYQKILKIPKQYIKNVYITMMYYQKILNECIELYYKLYKHFILYGNGVNVYISPVFSLPHYKSVYTHDQYLKYKETYKDKEYMYIDYLYVLLTDQKGITRKIPETQLFQCQYNFNKWHCSAGRNSIFIDINGIIYPCQAINANINKYKIYKKSSSIITIYNFLDMKFNFKSTLCSSNNCELCDVIKVENIFNRKNSIVTKEIEKFKLI